MYDRRSIQCLELWHPEPWHLKIYGITSTGERPFNQLVATAKKIATEHALPMADDHYGVGFIGVHEGLTANFIFVDWWENTNELHHHVYTAPVDEHVNFTYQTPTGLTGCIWDLFLQNYEREAWINQVLKPKLSNFNDYLAEQFNGRA